jgi:hypothetical protein
MKILEGWRDPIEVHKEFGAHDGKVVTAISMFTNKKLKT